MSERGKHSYSIQSVENALDVLEALCEEEVEVPISYLSEKLGMNKTSVFRLLATFENRGYVERVQGSGHYRLGFSTFELGQKFLSHLKLSRMSRPIMERLARQCNEAVYLAVHRDAGILFLDMVDTAQQVKVISLVGKRFSLSKTSAGKVILAHVTPAERLDWQRRGQVMPTEEERTKVYQRGVLADRNILGEGITSLAVPLFETGGKIPGCLCLIGPNFRMTPEKMEGDFLPNLKEAGNIVSRGMGFFGRYRPNRFQGAQPDRSTAKGGQRWD